VSLLLLLSPKLATVASSRAATWAVAATAVGGADWAGSDAWVGADAWGPHTGGGGGGGAPVALTYVGAGTAPSGTGLPATGNLTATPNPPTMADGDLVLVATGSKPDTAGVTVSDPAWTYVGNGAGGAGVQGAGTGPVRESWYTRVKDPSWSAMPDFTLDGTGNCLWAHAYVIRADVAGSTYDVAMASGVRTVESTAWSVTCDTNPGLAAGDMVLFGGATALGSLTVTGEGITAPGATFGTATEIGEPKTTRNNDVGGFTAETTVTAGTATGAPTVTATMSAAVGATGVSTVVRVRGVAVSTEPTTTVGSTRGTSWAVAGTVAATRATTWDVIGLVTVTATRATTWATIARVAPTHATTWTVRTPVAPSTRATTWAARTRVTDSRATTWQVLTPVESTRDTSWFTDSNIQISSRPFLLLGLTGHTLTVVTPTITTVGSTRDTTWGVSAAAVPGHATFLASTSGTTTAPLPPGAQTGDMILAYAFSSTATTPTLPTGWSVVTNNAASPAFRLQYRVYDGAWTMPTFTNAAQVHAILIRGQATTTPAASLGTLNATSATITWPASDTPTDLSGASVFIRAAVHSNPGVIIPTPTGYTKLQGDGTSPGFITIAKDDTTTLGGATATVTNSAAYSRNTVEVKAAPVTTTVTDTRGTSWGTNAVAASARGTTWATAAAVTGVRDTSWTARTPVTTARGTTWAVTTPVTSTRGTTWATRTPLATTRATTWAARTTTATNRATSWTTAARTTSTHATTWTITATTTSTRASTWATGQQVADTRGSTWNVAGTLATVTATRGTTWAVAGTITTVTATRGTTWATTASVTATRASTWTVTARVTGTHATTWVARATTTNTRATTWATAQPVTSTRATNWGVAGALFTVTGARGTTWAVAGALVTVTTARGTTWTTRAFTTTTHGASWTVRTPVAPVTRGTTWAILTPAAATRSSTWATRAPVTTARATAWTTRARLAASHPATWDTLTRLTAAHATTWLIGTTVTSTRGTTWAQLEVEGPIGRITAVRWHILAASGDLSTPGAVGDLTILEAIGATR
jgi:hypothetical protein